MLNLPGSISTSETIQVKERDKKFNIDIEKGSLLHSFFNTFENITMDQISSYHTRPVGHSDFYTVYLWSCLEAYHTGLAIV